MPKHSDCILVIADQASLRAAIARLLVPLGYSVEIASSEKRARQLLGHGRFAGAVTAPARFSSRESAFLRELQGVVPRLAILANGTSEAKHLAMSFPEALVLVSVPLEHEKLLTFLSEPAPSTLQSARPPEYLHFAGRMIDVAGRIFLDTEQHEVPLTRGEFALLVAFARNYGRVLSRSQLRNAMDGGTANSYDRSIDMLVARLRRKIEPNPINRQFILTVPGVGYKFTPHVGSRPRNARPASQQTADQALDAAQEPRAERRQITVLCCQILGFAALATKLDPEDLDRAIDPVYGACAKVIDDYRGTVARTLGDSILAYFGYPKAHENDTRRAVGAALELLRAISGIKAAPLGAFRARVGVATGLMLIREPTLAGSGEAAGMGEALNLALHLQNGAQAQAALIEANTHRLVGGFFRCEEVEPIELEHEFHTVPAWRVVGEIAGIPRFDALRGDGMLEFVGREVEIDRLRQCWSKAIRRSGQVVLLSGEAGIGKSRLVIELQERLRGEAYASIRYSGSPLRVDAPMSVLVEELQSAAGFAQSDTVTRKVQKLQSHFAPLGGGRADATALSCMLLGLQFDTSSQVSLLSPQRRKERTFAALLARIEMIAARQPIFAVLEDAHWVDPTSLEFFALLVERASAMRLLLTIVARPEFAPPWPEHSHVTTLVLPRLSPADSALLVHKAAGPRCITAAVAADIVARADGVPLFVEELTKSVMEYSANDTGEGAPVPALPGIAPIPITLRALLLARLDRLERGKTLAQGGAVIGREFSFELLRQIADLDERTLSDAIEELISSGLVFRRASPPQATFIFKHALVREAAYGMIVRQRRQELHASVAQAYEAHFREIVDAQPELLGYHHREAENWSESIGYLITAAERALLRSATTEALSHLAQARDLIAKLPENQQRLQFELKLEIVLARTLLARSGYTALETRAAYQRARQCCEAAGDQAFSPLIMHGQWVCAWVAGDHPSALEAAQQLYLWGERNEEPVGMAVAHSDLGLTLMTLGRLTEARGHLAQALQIDKFTLPGRQPFIASDVDVRISTLSFMQHCLLLLGFPDKARAAAHEAAALQPENLYSRTLAQTRLLRMHVFARDARATAEGGFELLRLAEEQDYPYFAGTARVYVGWALAQAGEIARGIESCEKGLQQLRTLAAKCWLPFYLTLLAESYAHARDRRRAMQVITAALEAVEVSGERVWQAEILRLKGQLLIDDDPAAAQAYFTEAMHTARRQSAKLLELRASVNYAELLNHKNASMEARCVLAPSYASFTEGFDFIDLREAKALLDRLSSAS